GRTAFVLDEDFPPLLVLVVPRVDALDIDALAALAVTGANIVDVQRAADVSTVANLGDGVLGEAAPRGSLGPPLLNQPSECLAGVADGLLNGFATPFALQVAERETSVSFDLGQHSDELSLPARWCGGRSSRDGGT